MVHLMNLQKNRTRRIFATCLILAFLLPLCLPFYSSAATRSNVFFSCHTDRKVIALTFDDGPHPRYTRQILSLLKEYGITATFFMVGVNITRYPDVARAVAEGGHAIGNHTYTHPPVKERGDEEMRAEILRAEKEIEDIVGKKPTVFRPPEGTCPNRISSLAGRLGYSVILWTVDTRDWAATPPEKIVSNVMGHVKSGDILLFHDYVSYKNTTIDALKILLPMLIREGYQFVTVPELLMEEERYFESQAVS